MTLKDGIYAIRYVPPHVKLPFVGGIYATGEDINLPLRGEPMVPSVTGEQKWRVTKVKESGLYIIDNPGFTSPIAGIGPVLPGWGYRVVGSEQPVLFTVNLKEWSIQSSDDNAAGDNPTYMIGAHTNLIGVSIFVGESNNNIVLKSIPVVQHPPPPPRWQFILQD